MLFCASFLVGRKKPAVPLCVSKGETDKCKHLGGGAAVCTSFIVICITKSKNNFFCLLGLSRFPDEREPLKCLMTMQSYAHSHFNPSILQFFNSPSYGAYTKFATETAILVITVAKSPFSLPYDDGYSIICNGQK